MVYKKEKWRHRKDLYDLHNPVLRQVRDAIPYRHTLLAFNTVPERVWDDRRRAIAVVCPPIEDIMGYNAARYFLTDKQIMVDDKLHTLKIVRLTEFTDMLIQGDILAWEPFRLTLRPYYHNWWIKRSMQNLINYCKSIPTVFSIINSAIVAVKKFITSYKGSMDKIYDPRLSEEVYTTYVGRRLIDGRNVREPTEILDFYTEHYAMHRLINGQHINKEDYDELIVNLEQKYNTSKSKIKESEFLYEKASIFNISAIIHAIHEMVALK